MNFNKGKKRFIAGLCILLFLLFTSLIVSAEEKPDDAPAQESQEVVNKDFV